ncbi:MAG: hypothetical protein IJQ29_00760 [Synergistaceae bacterium]|nr:hypothetical protein [Synergistaceae bacterium]
MNSLKGREAKNEYVKSLSERSHSLYEQRRADIQEKADKATKQILSLNKSGKITYSERRSLMMTLNSQITGAFRIAENIRKGDSDVTQRLRGRKKIKYLDEYRNKKTRSS